MTEPPSSESCATCRFQINGRCQARPPVIQNGDGEAVWPTVLGTDWCGAWNWDGTPPAEKG